MSLEAIVDRAKSQLANQQISAHLNAFISCSPRATVIRRVRAAHENVRPNAVRGRLVAIKDNICTTELPTTAGSAMLKDFQSPYDATVVKLLRDAGAVVAGKANMDEFGMGSHTTHSHFGPSRTKKRWDEAGDWRSAGGSSGGSAIAVARDYCCAALGTDTGGSVRLPAAYTGVVGFKPSYGLLSRWGVIAYANSLDTVGILAKRDICQVESIFDTLNVYDPQDPTSLSPSTRARLATDYDSQSLLRIGVPLDYNISSLDPAVREAWLSSLARLQALGHTLHPVRLPTTKHALSAYYVLAPAEASSNLAKFDGVRYGSRAEGVDGTPDSVLFAKTRGQGFGPEVQRRILLGAFSLSAQAIDNYFIQAQKVRRLVQQDFDRVFAAPNPLVIDDAKLNKDGVDVLLCPTAPTLAPTLDEVEKQSPTQAYMNDVFTVPASLAGLPAISVPTEYHDTSNVSPPAMQIIGQYGHDKMVLDVAKQLQWGSRTGQTAVTVGQQVQQ